MTEPQAKKSLFKPEDGTFGRTYRYFDSFPAEAALRPGYFDPHRDILGVNDDIVVCRVADGDPTKPAIKRLAVTIVDVPKDRAKPVEVVALGPVVRLRASADAPVPVATGPGETDALYWRDGFGWEHRGFGPYVVAADGTRISAIVDEHDKRAIERREKPIPKPAA